MEHPPREVTAKGVLLPESRKTPLDSHGKIRISGVSTVVQLESVNWQVCFHYKEKTIHIYIYICVRLYVNISICIPLRDLLAAKTSLRMKYVFFWDFHLVLYRTSYLFYYNMFFFWQLFTLVLFWNKYYEQIKNHKPRTWYTIWQPFKHHQEIIDR